jgi:hypothetical protein
VQTYGRRIVPAIAFETHQATEAEARGKLVQSAGYSSRGLPPRSPDAFPSLALRACSWAIAT